MSESERHVGKEGARARPPTDGATEADERGSFLGFVAHEMRNPLSTALWSAELLVRLSASERGGARGEKLAGMCLRSLQRLRHLVEDHFLSERLEVGGIPLRLEVVPLRQVAESVAGKPHSPGVSADVGDDLVAWADRGLVERALEGLVAVASKGPVPVRVDAEQKGCRVDVKVHGAAPAADALEPPRKGTASDPSGHALALHMVARVAARLGGELSALVDGYALSLPVAPDQPAEFP